MTVLDDKAGRCGIVESGGSGGQVLPVYGCCLLKVKWSHSRIGLGQPYRASSSINVVSKLIQNKGESLSGSI